MVITTSPKDKIIVPRMKCSKLKEVVTLNKCKKCTWFCSDWKWNGYAFKECVK